MTRKIGVGFDGSDSSRKALQEAIRLAVMDHSTLEVISIEELPRYPGSMSEVVEEQQTANEHVQQLQEEAKRLAAEHDVQIHTVTRIGHPAKALVDHASEAKLEILVIGHTGHSALWGTFLGTTADKVVRHAPCSVLVVR